MIVALLIVLAFLAGLLVSLVGWAFVLGLIAFFVVTFILGTWMAR